MIVTALLALVAAQDVEGLKRELQLLKEHVTAREAYIQELEKRLGAIPKAGVGAAPGAPVPVTPRAGAADDERRRAEEAAKRVAEQKLYLDFKNPGGGAAPEPRVGKPHPVDGQVTALANEIGLVVISAGREEGILPGDEFTISRGGEFVAKIVIDRTDRKWSAGKIVLRKSDPRVGDDASNRIFIAPTRAPSSDDLRAIRKELDEVRKQVRALSDTLLPAWQGPGVALEDASEELRAQLGIARGVLVRRVKEGSAAEKAGLKVNDLIPDLAEAQVLDALQAGKPLRLLRQGREVTTPK